MNRILVATAMTGLMLTSSSAFATEEQSTTAFTPAIAAVATSLVLRTEPAAAITLSPRFNAQRRPSLLPSLYIASALLQSYDAYSTLTALKAGAVEANPMMKSVTKSPMLFVGLKAGVTVASVMAAERLWKDHHRVGAVMLMVATNSAMAMVAAHNASVLHRLQ